MNNKKKVLEDSAFNVRKCLRRKGTRMNYKKVWVYMGMLLIFILMAAGCSNTKDTGSKNEDEQNTGKGRYVEETIAFPENLKSVFAIRKLKDGSLLLVADTLEDALNVYTSKDEGNTWTKSDTIGSTLIPEDKRIVAAAIDTTGKLYISYAAPMDMEHLDTVTAFTGSMAYCSIDAEGTVQDLELSLADLDDGDDFADGLYHLAVNSTGDLFGSTENGTIYQLDIASGELKNTYPSEGSSDRFFPIWDKLLVIREDRIEQFTLDGDKLDDLNILKDYLAYQGMFNSSGLITEGNNEDEIYFCNKNGVYRYTYGGNVVEQLVDGSLSNLSAVNVTSLAFLQKNDGNFQILYNNPVNKRYELVDYAYDASIPTVPTDELRIYSMRKSDTIQRMVTAFQKDNPDIHVIYETGTSGENAISEADAVKTLNTEMMAGNGPDILVLDHMPIDSYMEKGMLHDMSELFGTLKEENDLFMNIVGAYEQNGKLYAAPIRFKIPYIAGLKEVIEQVTDIRSLAQAAQTYMEEHPDGKFIYAQYEDVEFQKLFSVYYQECFLEDGSINEENLKSFLKNYKKLYETAIKYGDLDPRKGYWNLEQNKGSTIDFMDNYEDIYFNTSEYTDIDTALTIGTLYSIKSFSDFKFMKDKYPNYIGKLPNSEVHYLKPVSPVGINSKSKNFVNANKFISFLFSDVAQEIECYDGLSVNRSIFLNEEEKPSDMSSYNMGRTKPYRWASKEEFEELNAIVESLNTPYYTNRYVIKMIYENAENYITGDGNIDEAMEHIMQKLNLYLSE